MIVHLISLTAAFQAAIMAAMSDPAWARPLLAVIGRPVARGQLAGWSSVTAQVGRSVAGIGPGASRDLGLHEPSRAVGLDGQIS